MIKEKLFKQKKTKKQNNITAAVDKKRIDSILKRVNESIRRGIPADAEFR